MPIDNTSFSLSALMPPPTAGGLKPDAAWPTEQQFEGHLRRLRDLPIGAQRSPAEAREAERIYDDASPIKHWLENPGDDPGNATLLSRMGTITFLAMRQRLPLEHARRLLVPGEPSWLRELNTPERVQVAYMLIGTITRWPNLTDANAAAGRALLLQLLEVVGDSPSRVLLSMDLHDGVAGWLPALDRRKHHLCSQLRHEMEQLRFTDSEIRQAFDVPRKRLPPPPWLATQTA